MSKPNVAFDFEFVFKDGGLLYVSAIEGRDGWAVSPERVELAIRPDEHTEEQYDISRAALAYRKTTRRVMVDEPETPGVPV